MGRYRYQIFDTVDTGLRCDGIDTRKQYRRVSIHARAALRMRKVYVSTRSRENQWCHLVVTVVVTGSSSQISSINHVLRHVDIFLFLNQNLWVVYLSVCVCMCMLSTCLSCIDASLLLSIGIEKKYRIDSIERSVLGICIEIKKKVITHSYPALQRITT